MMFMAERKLRLDQVVIQQGRLIDTAQKLDKESMLHMLRHTANYLLSVKDSNITDDDIDAILLEGAKRTAQLKEKLDKLGENQLREFSIDSLEDSAGDGAKAAALAGVPSEFSAYKFEGEDWRLKQQASGGDSFQFFNWMEPQRRERKILSYAEGEGARGAAQLPRPPRFPNLHDFQFFPRR